MTPARIVGDRSPASRANNSRRISTETGCAHDEGGRLSRSGESVAVGQRVSADAATAWRVWRGGRVVAGTRGSDWEPDEIRATVEAYFRVWQEGGARKSGAYRDLSAQFPERTPKAFEYKFQNISAVLAGLGLDWMPGLKPKANVQHALLNEVERYLHEIQRADPDANRNARWGSITQDLLADQATRR